MFVGPSSITARGVDDTVDRIGPYEVPWKHRRTAAVTGIGPVGITRQTGAVDRAHSTVCYSRSWRSAIQLGLVNVDAFFVFRGRAIWCSGHTRAGEHTVSSVMKWWR